MNLIRLGLLLVTAKKPAAVGGAGATAGQPTGFLLLWTKAT